MIHWRPGRETIVIKYQSVTLAYSPIPNSSKIQFGLICSANNNPKSKIKSTENDATRQVWAGSKIQKFSNRL